MANFNKIKEGNLQTSTAHQKIILVFELNLALYAFYTGHLQHRSVYDIVIEVSVSISLVRITFQYKFCPESHSLCSLYEPL